MTKITVMKNNTALLGLKFTYEDGQSDEFIGRNGRENGGPLTSTDIDLLKGEVIVGVTIE